MDPLYFGLAGMQGALNLGSTFLQNYYNKQMAEYQNDKNLEFWHMQNEYNSPSATMNRLVDAGINPRAYQQIGQFANAGQMQPAAAPSKISELSAFQSVARQGLENELLRERVKQAKADTRVKNFEAQLKDTLGDKYDADKKNTMLRMVIYGLQNGVDPKDLFGSFFQGVMHDAETRQPWYHQSALYQFLKTKSTTHPYLTAILLGNQLKSSGISLRNLEREMKSDDYETGVRGSSDGANIVRFIKNLFK